MRNVVDAVAYKRININFGGNLVGTRHAVSAIMNQNYNHKYHINY